MSTALITGAGAGLGAAIADALAPTHALLLAGRPSPRLDAVAERLGATTWPMDLTDLDGIEEAADLFDELDVLVHNAGVAYPGRFAESSPDQWRASFEVNVTGAVALTLALLPAPSLPAQSVVAFGFPFTPENISSQIIVTIVFILCPWALLSKGSIDLGLATAASVMAT